MVAVTKSDAVDEETLELALEEARELVPGAEVVAVSAKTGAGLDELRAALARVPVEPRDASAATRLYVDRVFTLPGVGHDRDRHALVGRDHSGRPAAGRASGHDGAGAIGAGARHGGRDGRGGTARRRQPARRSSDATSRAGTCSSSRATTRSPTGSTSGSSRSTEIPAAVTVHVGTNAVPARIVRDGEYAQLRLQEKVVAARGDHVVLRTETTVGGGVVLDPAPVRGLDRARLAALDDGTPQEIVRALVHEPVTAAELQSRGLLVSPAARRGARVAFVRPASTTSRRRGSPSCASSCGRRLAERAASSPLDPGLPLAELLPNTPWAPAVLDLLEIERRGAKAYLPGTTAALGERADAARELEAQLAQEEIAKTDDKQLAAFLEEEGRIRRVGDGYAVSAALYERGAELLPEARGDHARGVPRRARRRPAHGAAPARAL